MQKNISTRISYLAVGNSNNIIRVRSIRQIRSSQSTGNNQKVKKSNGVSRAEFEALQHENQSLKEELKQCRKKWMHKLQRILEENLFSFLARPTGAALNYFFEIYNLLRNQSIDEDDDDECDDELQSILTTLNMTETQLKSCLNRNSITKTCRNITKRIYPSAEQRSKMSVSKMNRETLAAIHSKFL